MLTHMWIQDRVDFEEVGKQYTDITAKWRGCRIHKLEGKYCGEEVTVIFVSKRVASDLNNWGGFCLQKIICFEAITMQTMRYFITRLREQDDLPKISTSTPRGARVVVERLLGKEIIKDADIEFLYVDGDPDITSERVERDLEVFL